MSYQALIKDLRAEANSNYVWSGKLGKFKKEYLLTQIRFLEPLFKALEHNPSNSGAIKKKIANLLDSIMVLLPVAIPRYRAQPIENQGDIRPHMERKELFKVGRFYYEFDLNQRPPGNGVIDSNHQNCRLSNGHYVFVIPMQYPTSIWLGQRVSGGHTAISRGADVYFAGTIKFTQGNLDWWNNDSGHYQPISNLHQQVNHLLPARLYQQKV